MEPLADRRSYDAVVVGARCAGAATAMLLARRGLSVLLVDRDRRGADTLSTLALMRGGVLQLHRWGLLDRIREAGTPAITSTSFVYGDESITLPIKPRDGVDGIGPIVWLAADLLLEEELLEVVLRQLPEPPEGVDPAQAVSATLAQLVDAGLLFRRNALRRRKPDADDETAEAPAAEPAAETV